MKKTQITDFAQEVRDSHLNVFSVIKINKALSFSLSFVFVVAAAIFGFSMADTILGSDSAALSTTKMDSAIVSEISNQEVVCLEIEAIDREEQNDILREENQTIKEETETIEQTILDALLTNLENKKLSNRSSTLTSYLQEARNLLDLNWKLQNFKNTEDYNLIDLTSYESAIDNKLSYIPTLKPIPGPYNGFGWRIHPIYKNRQFHPAADQGAASGTSIRAAASGYVVRASWEKSMGYNICINHGNGFVTTYMHNSANLVKAGDRVFKGQVIGRVGSTGTSTTPHLHFEVTYNGTPFNPQQILMHN